MMKLRLISLAIILTGCSSLPSFISTPPENFNALSGRVGINGEVLVVKVDDTRPAHPQIGIELADVVYVEQVEAGLTRLAAVFSSQIPPSIGPVRSARISDIDIFSQYGRVAFAYSGAQSKMLPIIASANWIDLGAQHEPSSIYSRDSTRFAPVNMMLDGKALLARAASKGKIPVNAKSIGWTFGDPPEGGKELSRVEVRWPSTKYEVKWNGTTFELVQDGRLETNSDGLAYHPTTVVIQLVTIRPSEFRDKFGGVTPKSEVIGSGKALILRDGRIYNTTWSRPSSTSPTTWLLPDGKEINFARGQVWVLLADQSRPPTVELAPLPEK